MRSSIEAIARAAQNVITRSKAGPAVSNVPNGGNPGDCIIWPLNPSPCPAARQASNGSLVAASTPPLAQIYSQSTQCGTSLCSLKSLQSAKIREGPSTVGQTLCTYCDGRLSVAHDHCVVDIAYISNSYHFPQISRVRIDTKRRYRRIELSPCKTHLSGRK